MKLCPRCGGDLRAISLTSQREEILSCPDCQDGTWILRHGELVEPVEEDPRRFDQYERRLAGAKVEK